MKASEHWPVSITSMTVTSDAPTSGAPGTRQVVKGQGVVEFGRNCRPSKIWTRYGDIAPNLWLNNPLPNVTYVVGANLTQLDRGVRLHHVFQTDPLGITERAVDHCVRVYKSEEAGKRWPRSRCTPAGYPGSPYDRGHLISRQFGAGMEAINLVTMPSSVNQAHRPSTAVARGFEEIALLDQEYLNPYSILRGSLGSGGDFKLPNYRQFEQVVNHFVRQGKKESFDVVLKVEPSTFGVTTDIIHAKIFLGQEPIPIRFSIDCNVSSPFMDD